MEAVYEYPVADTLKQSLKSACRRRRITLPAPNLSYRALSDQLKLDEILTRETAGVISDLLGPCLLVPAQVVFSQPGKRIRAQLVRIGFDLARGSDSATGANLRLRRAIEEFIEIIHAGTLVIDDIEDGSQVRRGKPALHRQYGVPLALNTGNWLYFWPTELVRRIRLPPERELRLYQFYHRVLVRAHCGQALDLGTNIYTLEQTRVPKICLAVMELKTGSLTSLALASGAIVSGARPSLVSLLERYGRAFGVGLQMCDDLGNLTSLANPDKRFEDLILRRPSWVVGFAAKHYPQRTYADFLSAVQSLPVSGPLQSWLEKHQLVQIGKKHVQRYMAKLCQNLTSDLKTDGARAPTALLYVLSDVVLSGYE